MKWRALAGAAALVIASYANPASAQAGAERKITAALANRALVGQWTVIRRNWVRELQRCGRNAGCRALTAYRRTAFTAALTARISDPNPTLLDLEPGALLGEWVVSPVTAFDGQARDFPLESGVPPPGARVAGKPGEICFERNCRDFGLEPIVLGDNQNARDAASVGLTPQSRGWVAIVNGKANYTVFGVGRNVVFLVSGCKRRADGSNDCVASYVMLTPVNKMAQLVRLR